MQRMAEEEKQSVCTIKHNSRRFVEVAEEENKSRAGIVQSLVFSREKARCSNLREGEKEL